MSRQRALFNTVNAHKSVVVREIYFSLTPVAMFAGKKEKIIIVIFKNSECLKYYAWIPTLYKTNLPVLLSHLQ